MADKGQQVNKEAEAEVVPTRKPLSRVVPWIVGAAGGALVVGAVWATVAHVQNQDVVLAKVGDNPIVQSQFYSKLEAASGTQMMQQLISNQLVNDAAQKYNVTASQDDMNKALSDFESQAGVSSSDQLNALLAQYNMKMSDLQDILKVQVLEQKLAERGVTVSDKEVQDYYNAHKSDFTKQGEKTPQPLSAVKSQIEDLLKQSKATPPDQLLANLAKEDPITILDTKYASVKQTIENPAPAQ